jgi:DNA-binding MarR family transcriptional regulator
MKGLSEQQIDLLREIEHHCTADRQRWCESIKLLSAEKSNSARASLSRAIKRLRNRELVQTTYDQSRYRLRLRLTGRAKELLAIMESL